MRKVLFLVVVALSVVVGCNSGPDKSLFDQIKLTEAEKTDLTLKVERLEEENAELKQRLETLTGIDKEERLEVLERISQIEIAKRTGFYDKDGDGSKESLIVYVRTIDDSGDAVKAAGSVEVALWDLSGKEGGLLAQWRVEPAELKELWASTVMTNYFRMTFDITDILPGNSGEELTVKVVFTDYITGKVLNKQAVVKR